MKSNKCGFNSIILYLLIILNLVSVSFAVSASIQNLGSLVGEAVSDDGSTVVGGGPGNLAHRWYNGTLEQLPNLPGHSQSHAADVSADGSVIVGTSEHYDVDTGAFLVSGFRWENGMLTNLGYLNPGYKYTKGMGVSADGSIIVGDSISSYDKQAYKWTQADGMQGLGYLPGQYTSYADAISSDGSIIAGYGSSVAGPVAIMWKDGMKTPLGDLSGGVYESMSFDVSNNGTIVGRSTSAQGQEAFRWTQETGMVGLGDFTGGRYLSWANAVTEDGSIVVGQGETDNGSVAFIWDELNGLRSIQYVLENDFGMDLTGWSLSKAIDITPDGSVIIGTGYYNQSYSTWMVTIPEPATLFLLGLGAVMLRRKHRA